MVREVPLGGDPRKHWWEVGKWAREGRLCTSGHADGQAAAGNGAAGGAQETDRMGSDLSSSRGG